MKNIFLKIWLVIGSYVILVSVMVMLVVVRFAKWFGEGKSNTVANKDVFQNSRTYPLPPNLEKKQV